ncbi:MAG TPA: hypothetical protein EYG79_13620 [Rhodobacteraceae bacterium]|nr:hypothetical protein [Paracoccaceae bacterium]
MIRYLKFLSFGILFVGLQEFWVSYIWRGDFRSFVLAITITEGLFLSIAFALRRWLPLRFEALGLFIIMGLLGLVGIEWLLVGNTPSQSDASQIVMFATWGGAAVFALLQTDKAAPKRLKRFAFWAFLVPALLATLAALATGQETAFAITYLTAITLYPLMAGVWVAYAFHQANPL